MPPLKVHLLYEPKPEDLAVLQAHLDSNVECTFGADLPDPAIFQVLVAGRPTRDQLQSVQELNCLVIPFAGLPAETAEVLRSFPDLAIYNLHHNASATAEMAVTLLLAAAKYLLPFDQDLRRGDWTRRYQPSPALQLSGRSALILGFGEVGRKVARVCHALGMDIIATRRAPQQPVDVDFPVELHPAEALPNLLPRAQALIITLPYTANTRDLIGAEELARLPVDCILVNVGRGLIINQGALYQALFNGQIRAAGLDVWYNYPANIEDRSHRLPADYPFHQLENVVFSPHRAGLVEGIESQRYHALASLLNDLALGRPVANRIDLAQGY